MNTPTNHEQFTKQEAEIRTLLQTTNSSQSKRQKYEHSYKPRTALKTRDRNTNTPTNHEHLKNTRGKKTNTPTNHEQLSKQEAEI